MQIVSRLAEISARIQKSRGNAPLAAPQTELMGASKGQPEAAIEEAIKAGLSLYGENRVQDARDKWPAIKNRHPHVELHLIGPLQSNKAKEALELFDAIQTVDRVKLVDEIAKIHDSDGIIKTKKFFIQVNTGKEPQKAGVIPEEADQLIEYCKKRGLPLVGLMCVPPAEQPAPPHFALLREIALRHGLNELSMGMSGDFETAIRMGSTCVRIGTALFGERAKTAIAEPS
jgi:PLP dependent protein